ncbi:enoyl-CoA hydratase/isomerase family protein [Ornithinimicrobium panacihumi]|uniref:enoyl-CoA hydratase/isomerase family protein n=1 Tax=Ornithinimicrobium panacihumi TaxID=2008449 RepID=UPI003F8A4FBA
MPSTTDPVLVDRDGAILTVTLNRPRRKNALDDHGWEQLAGVLGSARDDESIRVVVLTGADGDFCAGADVGGYRREVHPLTRTRFISDVARSLHDLPQPLIAKVSGVAVGAGCNLALAADLVVATPDARFSQIFVRRGLSPDFGGSWLLPRVVGLQQAKRLALLGEIIDADEAKRIGMVTWVVPADDVDRFVADTAAALAAGPPVALALTKRMLDASMTATFEEALDTESRALMVNLATDAPAARRAFVERTEPTFEGRWRL